MDLITALPIILIGLVILSGLDERGVLLVAIVMAVAAWPIYTRVLRTATHVVRTSACRFGKGARGISPTPAHSTCAAGFLSGL